MGPHKVYQTCVQDIQLRAGRSFEEKAPPSISYDGFFIAGLMEFKYIHSLLVKRIVNYFEEHGFILKKPTVHKLIEWASDLFESLYKCIWQIVLFHFYISVDEIFYQILVPEKSQKGKGAEKEYQWVLKLVYLLYEKGS